MYRINTKRLRELIDAHGETGLARASIGARVSVSLMEKMYAGTYKSSPREVVRERLAAFLKVPQEELFTLVRARKKQQQQEAS
jgi:hypothetical protein